MTPTTQTTRRILAVAATATVLMIQATSAHAVSSSVKRACIGDYFSYCSNHSVGTPGVRKCFKANGHRLSKRCVSALLSAGMVPKSLQSKKAARRH